MTREELYQSIYTHETIYIPPQEEGSAALEVALGCSWHKCTFCDFARDEFCIHPLSRIEHNLQILRMLQPENTRLFLLGENAFCLSTEFLCQIIDLVAKYMPNVHRIAMYSRADDILRKTDEELRLLKSRGVAALHIGVESGSDPILAERCKGVTSAQILDALHRLEQTGIDYFVTIIPGLGGREYSHLHALETARLLNQLHPKNIWCLKLKLWEDTKLCKEAQKGFFQMMTPEEILLEERLMLENLHVKDWLFEDTTVLDQYTIYGMLPDQKKDLLRAIDYLLARP